MHYEPRNTEANAQFIEAGGLKNWGCFAFLLVVLVLALLFVLMHVLLLHIIGDPLTWWASSVFLVVVIVGVLSLWIRSRRRQRREQELVWQRAIENSSGAKKS